jgi:hypothetical protein
MRHQCDCQMACFIGGGVLGLSDTGRLLVGWPKLGASNGKSERAEISEHAFWGC